MILIEDESTQQETLEAIHAAKFHKLKIKTRWAVLLSLPVVVIGMFFMDMPYANLIMWLFSTPVVLWLGKDFFHQCVETGETPFGQYGYTCCVEHGDSLHL
jgi:Cu2+-exporting ATPase